MNKLSLKVLILLSLAIMHGSSLANELHGRVPGEHLFSIPLESSDAEALSSLTQGAADTAVCIRDNLIFSWDLVIGPNGRIEGTMVAGDGTVWPARGYVRADLLAIKLFTINPIQSCELSGLVTWVEVDSDLIAPLQGMWSGYCSVFPNRDVLDTSGPWQGSAFLGPCP